MMLGFDESEQAFKDFYDEKEEVEKTDKDNDYSDIFKEKMF